VKGWAFELIDEDVLGCQWIWFAFVFRTNSDDVIIGVVNHLSRAKHRAIADACYSRGLVFVELEISLLEKLETRPVRQRVPPFTPRRGLSGYVFDNLPKLMVVH
jgi:hypothetical protein